ncbi:hypothetical protein BHM03_00000039 [Ensete ventricosum]|uniref:Uncharacterized protein n=1 Tax=Ensete ventricosum TaxID=4639 RepID=A0A445M861_ENSVE|nr:hypothetical protein BHM03_00000039 [Ensete ventricosum]
MGHSDDGEEEREGSYLRLLTRSLSSPFLLPHVALVSATRPPFNIMTVRKISNSSNGRVKRSGGALEAGFLPSFFAKGFACSFAVSILKLRHGREVEAVEEGEQEQLQRKQKSGGGGIRAGRVGERKGSAEGEDDDDGEVLLQPVRQHVDFLVELIDTVVQGTFDCTRAKRGPPAPAATIGCPVDPTRRGAVNGQLRHDHGRRSGAVLAGVVRRESFLEQGAGPGHTVTLVPRGSTGLGWVQ